MKLGSAWDLRNVQRRDWRRVADATGVPWAEARAILLQLAAAVHQVTTEVAATCRAAFGPSPIYDQIIGVIARQTPVLERALRLP